MASEALKVNKSLKEIVLTDNKIGPDGAKALGEVHGRCPCECSLEMVSGSPYTVCLYCNAVARTTHLKYTINSAYHTAPVPYINSSNQVICQRIPVVVWVLCVPAIVRLGSRLDAKIDFPRRRPAPTLCRGGGLCKAGEREREGGGTRRVRLVRGEGRDVST